MKQLRHSEGAKMAEASKEQRNTEGLVGGPIEKNAEKRKKNFAVLSSDNGNSTCSSSSGTLKGTWK